MWGLLLLLLLLRGLLGGRLPGLLLLLLRLLRWGLWGQLLWGLLLLLLWWPLLRLRLLVGSPTLCGPCTRSLQVECGTGK